MGLVVIGVEKNLVVQNKVYKFFIQRKWQFFIVFLIFLKIYKRNKIIEGVWGIVILEKGNEKIKRENCSFFFIFSVEIKRFRFLFKVRFGFGQELLCSQFLFRILKQQMQY